MTRNQSNWWAPSSLCSSSCSATNGADYASQRLSKNAPLMFTVQCKLISAHCTSCSFSCCSHAGLITIRKPHVNWVVTHRTDVRVGSGYDPGMRWPVKVGYPFPPHRVISHLWPHSCMRMSDKPNLCLQICLFRNLLSMMSVLRHYFGRLLHFIVSASLLCYCKY